MINLDHVQLLEKKVHTALEFIRRLRDENKLLRDKLNGSQRKMTELENLVNTFTREQDAIEKGILNVLTKLDKLEDEVSASEGLPRNDPTVAREKKEKPASRPGRDDEKGKAPPAERAKSDDGSPSEEEIAAQQQDELDIF